MERERLIFRIGLTAPIACVRRMIRPHYATMIDAFEHINRMGDVYRLQSKPGGDGRPRYSFARKITGAPAAAIPDGYEAREDPVSAQVTLRKIKPTAILPREKLLLETTIARSTKGVLFIVDVEPKAMIVYTSDIEVESRLGMVRTILPMDEMTARRMRASIMRNARYQKVMRFTLDDADKRLFSLDRWHFSGSIDNWYSLAWGRPLGALAEEYVKHLGQESYFELM